MVEYNGILIDLKRKCELLNVVRSTIYYEPKETKNIDVEIMNEIRNIYQETPFYGYRRITVALRQRGFEVNHKKTQRLLQSAGIKAIYPSKSTTVRNYAHKIYPYLLRGLEINRPNQAWQVDITYIKIRHGFVYFICLLDVFSRKIMGRTVSTFLDTQSCLEALSMALKFASPEIVNSDQGCQFTSNAWTETLTKNGTLISMDGKGRWADNVYIERLWRTIKYELVYIYSFENVDQARIALYKFTDFYNQTRFHQSLNYHTPNAIYQLKTIPTKQQLFEQFALQYKSPRGEVNVFPK